MGNGKLRTGKVVMFAANGNEYVLAVLKVVARAN